MKLRGNKFVLYGWPEARPEVTEWTLDDLMLLREAQITIDEETFASALHYENMHRGFAACSDCGAITFTQHQQSCPRASVLWSPDWFEKQRDPRAGV